MRACFDLGVAGVQHALRILLGQAAQFVGIIGEAPDRVAELMQESGDARGQGVAWIGADTEFTAPLNARQTPVGIAAEVRSARKERAIGVEGDCGIVSRVFRHGSGIGMLEENFTRGGLEYEHVLRAIVEIEIQGFESGGDVGVRFAEPGAARVVGGQDGEDVLAGLLDEQATCAEDQKPRIDENLRSAGRDRVVASSGGTKGNGEAIGFFCVFEEVSRERGRRVPG